VASVAPFVGQVCTGPLPPPHLAEGTAVTHTFPLANTTTSLRPRFDQSQPAPPNGQRQPICDRREQIRLQPPMPGGAFPHRRTYPYSTGDFAPSSGYVLRTPCWAGSRTAVASQLTAFSRIPLDRTHAVNAATSFARLTRARQFSVRLRGPRRLQRLVRCVIVSEADPKSVR
jgi:hypothetical protein